MGRMARAVLPMREFRTAQDGGRGEVEGGGVDVGEEGGAPQRRMALTEAKKLKGEVITASPGPIPAAAMASQSASVPLAHPMA